MNLDKAASISSGETGHSRPWADVVSLGERIVTQLGLADSVDTLARWMSHRVAELMKQAEGGDEQAERGATDLILRLWAHRSHWPQGWPPTEMEKVRRRLETQTFPERPEERDPTAPWLSRLTDLARLQETEYQIWLRLALAEAPIDEDVSLAQELQDDLDEKELSFVRLLTINRQAALEHFAKHLEGEDSPLARAQLAQKELDEVQARKLQLFEQALAEHDSSPPSSTTRNEDT